MAAWAFGKAGSVLDDREGETRVMKESKHKLAQGNHTLAAAKDHDVDRVMLKPLEDELKVLTECHENALECKRCADETEQTAQEMVSELRAAVLEGNLGTWLKDTLMQVKDLEWTDMEQEMQSSYKFIKWHLATFTKQLDRQQAKVTQEMKVVTDHQQAFSRPAGADEAEQQRPVLKKEIATVMSEKEIATLMSALDKLQECEKAMYYSEGQKKWFECLLLGPTTDGGVWVGVEKITENGMRRTEYREVPKAKLATNFKNSEAWAAHLRKLEAEAA